MEKIPGIITEKFGKIKKTEYFSDGYAGKVIKIDFEDHKQLIYKTYLNFGNPEKICRKEWEGLKILRNNHIHAPEPFLLGTDSEEPFILLEYIDGNNFIEHYQSLNDKGKQKMSDRYAEILIKLKHIDIQNIPNLRMPKNPVRKEILDIQNKTVDYHLEGFDPLIDWLKDHQTKIQTAPPCFCHRDMHPWNMIIRNSNQEPVLFDCVWTVSDCRFDTAWSHTLLKRSGFSNLADQILHSYQKLSGEDLLHHDFDYFQILTTARWLVNVFSSIRKNNPEYKHFEDSGKKDFTKMISPMLRSAEKLILQICQIRLKFTV